MNEAERNLWKAVGEIGITTEPSGGNPNAARLTWPVRAESLEGHGLLVTDEQPLESNVPFRIQCRTLIISPSGETLFDSSALGAHDAFGCRMDDDHFAILRRTCWKILVFRFPNELVFQIDLTRISNHLPRILTFTPDNTFLLTCLSTSHRLDLVELDRNGRAIWFLPRNQNVVGVPGSMQLLANNNILVADEYRHVVQEIKRDGSQILRWGEWAVPSSGPKNLSNPKWAKELENGALIIADAHNHRLVRIESDGSSRTIAPEDRSLLCPSFVIQENNGAYTVCDAANRCVLTVEPSGCSKVRVGNPVIKANEFSFPRSVQFLGSGRYLVADTARNRVGVFEGGKFLEIPVNGERPLFWPRAARLTSGGSVVIADGRNSRVLEVSMDGQVIHELREILWNGQRISLKDPHDVRLMEPTGVLVVDSSLDLVFESAWDGTTNWVIGLDGVGLNDPHSAQHTPDGQVIISDSGNHRILFVNPDTGQYSELNTVKNGKVITRFDYPRYAEMSDDGTLVVVDSGNNRVILCGRNGEMYDEIDHINNSPFPSFEYPRWAHILGEKEVLVTDHFHHRIVHLKQLTA